MSSSIWICFYHKTITCCQVEPPAPPDDLLHAVLVSSRDAEPEDEDEDELEIVAEILNSGCDFLSIQSNFIYFYT